MTDVTLLSPQDVLFVFRLIERLRPLPGKAWRELLATELRPQFDACLGVSYLMKINLDSADTAPGILAMVESGANQFWKRYMAEGDLTLDPMTAPIMAHFGTDFTVTRSAWISETQWNESRFYKEVLVHAGWDHAIYSQVAIRPPGVVDGIGIARALGKPPFTEREVTLVRFMHGELARLWRTPSPLAMHELPARQRDVLECMRQGFHRKKIAEQLKVSENTVHSHEAAIFKRAGVNSRGELLSMLSDIPRPALIP
jgi:DNA-binding CsgD family transcriptional regulator